MKTLFTVLTAIAMSLTGCGDDSPPERPASAKKSINAAGDPAIQHTIFLNLGAKGLDLLAAAKVESATVDVTCEGSEKLNLTDPQFKLFDGSKNCVVKLKSFSLSNGRLYKPRAGGDFAQNKAGEIAIFDSGNLTLYVAIEQQLPALINAPADVKYLFSELNNFGDLDAQKKVEHGILTTLMGDFAVGISVKPPVFDDTTIEITGECMNQPVTGDNIQNGACLGDQFLNMRLALDDYPAVADRVVLEALSSEAKTLADLGAELVPAVAGVSNGGFKVILPFDGTAPKDQILILNMKGSKSYLFGKISF